MQTRTISSRSAVVVITASSTITHRGGAIRSVVASAGLAGPAHRRPRADRLLERALDGARSGRSRACREDAQRAIDTARGPDAAAVAVAAMSILGLLELGLGHLGAACRHFDACAAMTGGTDAALLAPPFGADHVETLLGLREHERAAAVTDRVTSASSSGELRQRACAARCRALVAGAAEFEDAFEQALALCAQLPDPFEHARTRLCFGERLRRLRRRRAARAHLAEAAAALERIGAAPWACRAQRELQATTPTAAARQPGGRDELSARELDVVTLVAGGASVREAALQLWVSPKTADCHVQHAYRKLGVHNRAQLVQRLMLEGMLDPAGAATA